MKSIHLIGIFRKISLALYMVFIFSLQVFAQNNPKTMKTQQDFRYIVEKLTSYREKFIEIKPETVPEEDTVLNKWVIQDRYFQSEKSLMILTVILCKDAESAAQLGSIVYMQMTERENFAWGVIDNIVYEISGTNATKALEIEHLVNYLEGKSNFVNEWKAKLLFGSYILKQRPDLTAIQKNLPVGYRFITAENDKWFLRDFNGLGVEISRYKGSAKIVFVTFQEKKENEKLFADFLHTFNTFEYWGAEHNTLYYKQSDKPRKYPNLYYNSEDNKYFKWGLNNEE